MYREEIKKKKTATPQYIRRMLLLRRNQLSAPNDSTNNSNTIHEKKKTEDQFSSVNSNKSAPKRLALDCMHVCVYGALSFIGKSHTVNESFASCRCRYFD